MVGYKFLSTLVFLVLFTISIAEKELDKEGVFRNTPTVKITLNVSNLPFLDQLTALDILEALYDRLESDDVRSMALAQSFSNKPTQCQWNVVAGMKALYMADKTHGYVKLNITPIVDPNVSVNSEVVPDTNADNFYLFSTPKPGQICAY